MVSRCGACGGVCAGLLRQGPVALVLRHTYQRKAAPAECKGTGLGVSSLGRQYWQLCCLLKLVYAEGWGREMAPAPFHSPERGVCDHHCLGGPSRRGNNLHLCVSGVSHIPVSTLSVSGPSAHTVMQCTCVLSQAGWLSFKTPSFRDPMWYGPMLGPLREDLTTLRLVQAYPRRAVSTKAQGHGVWSKVQQRASVQVSYPQQVSLHLS